MGKYLKLFLSETNQIKIKKFYLKSVHFITVQHKLSRAFQTDMHNKLHKLNAAQKNMSCNTYPDNIYAYISVF